jgi:hypothetical protein
MGLSHHHSRSEMTMSGVPVIVAGQTHYRDKGFH